jgi:hypothetical protein
VTGFFYFFESADFVEGDKLNHSWLEEVRLQTWLDRGQFWIGWEKANAPSHDDLARKGQAAGYRLHDQHGNQWVLPIVRSPVDRGTLPLEYSFSPEGELIKKVKKQHERYWELAGEAMDYLIANGEVDQEEIDQRWPEEWVIRSAVEFLGINYRIGIHEIAALCEAGRAVVDTDFAIQVFYAVTDWEKVTQSEDFLKKKAEVRASFIEALQKQSHGAVA